MVGAGAQELEAESIRRTVAFTPSSIGAHYTVASCASTFRVLPVVPSHRQVVCSFSEGRGAEGSRNQ